jgi:hypothetical protein
LSFLRRGARIASRWRQSGVRGTRARWRRSACNAARRGRAARTRLRVQRSAFARATQRVCACNAARLRVQRSASPRVRLLSACVRAERARVRRIAERVASELDGLVGVAMVDVTTNRELLTRFSEPKIVTGYPTLLLFRRARPAQRARLRIARHQGFCTAFCVPCDAGAESVCDGAQKRRRVQVRGPAHAGEAHQLRAGGAQSVTPRASSCTRMTHHILRRSFCAELRPQQAAPGAAAAHGVQAPRDARRDARVRLG